jgi:hypothetical protein
MGFYIRKSVSVGTAVLLYAARSLFSGVHMRYQGKIQNWKEAQGFGFVMQNGGGGEKAFVHIKAFAARSRRPI